MKQRPVDFLLSLSYLSSKLDTKPNWSIPCPWSADLQKAQCEACGKDRVAEDLKNELAAARKVEAESRQRFSSELESPHPETDRQVAALRLELEHAL
jgi:hypothetical protein